MNPNIKFGIIQGRLTQPPQGQLQWFPQKSWAKEFVLAHQLGFDFIELIAERDHNPQNPIWSQEGLLRIKQLNRTQRLLNYSFCNDYIIDHALLGDQNVLSQTLHLIDQGKKLNVKKLILPLFEHSELNEQNFKSFKAPLKAIADHALKCKIEVCLETILPARVLVKVLKYFGHSNIKVVFDTGNRIAFGHDIYSDIVLLNKYISHVHIKDKNDQNENVFLGTGKVNFLKVFQSLKTIRYSKALCFETTRGKDPIATAVFHKSLIEFFIKEVYGA